MRFSAPPYRYFSRHHFPPDGASSRYKPPPSDSLTVLSLGTADRIAASVNMAGGNQQETRFSCPRSCHLLGWIPAYVVRRLRTRNRPATRMDARFLGLLETFWEVLENRRWPRRQESNLYLPLR